MGDETILIRLILPKPHRGAAPQIAKLILHDTAHQFVAHSLGMGVRNNLTLCGIIQVQTVVGADNYAMLLILEDREHCLSLQQHLPSIRAESILHRVIATQIGRGANPDGSTAISHHRHDPVVMHTASWVIALLHGEVVKFLRFQIIGTKALRECREIKMVVAIVGHHIDIVAVEIYLFSINSCQRIVGIKAFSCPNPIAPLLIPIDGIGLRRRCRM